MTALLVAVVQAAACMGFGATLLRLLRIDDLMPAERPGWSFALGFGTLGWLVFPVALAGGVRPAPLGALLAVGVVLLLWTRPWRGVILVPPRGAWAWLAVTLMATSAAMHLLQGFAPPADADTLAYHFARLRDFQTLGRLDFVPRAVDGATPMLVQMTYLPAFILGGERALTLWTPLSSLGMIAILLPLACRWLPFAWAAATTVVVVSAPGWVYGAGSGQVEVRIALFVLCASMIAHPAGRGSLRHAALAGIAAGFYAGAKLLGLLFIPALGLVLLRHRRWLLLGFVYSAAAVAAGGQWYIWHHVQSGDPVFPMLYTLLGADPSTGWSAQQHDFFRTQFSKAEAVVPTSPTWLLAYPFVATLAAPLEWEAGRTGLGPFALMVLPFALSAAWTRRARLAAHPLFPAAVALLLFYCAWFLSGASQRVRHLVPLFPVLVLVLTVAAHRWGRDRFHTGAVVLAFALAAGIHLAGQALFARNYALHLVRGESRDAFLARNVIHYPVVPWLNARLGPGDRLLTSQRQLLYLLNVPYYFGQQTFQALIELRATDFEADRAWLQARRLGITHVLVTPALAEGSIEDPLARLAHAALRAGCAHSLTVLEVPEFGSRTLPTLRQRTSSVEVLRLDTGNCVLEAAR